MLFALNVNCVKAAYGHEECADSLIHHGAAVNAHDVRGRTPLHMAAMCGHVALLGMLIQVTNSSLSVSQSALI